MSGVLGEKNRQKLAETFLTPTTWKYYCESISDNNCTSNDDGVAVRAPESDGEDGRFFADGLYTGYFRMTDKNNCTLNPKTCTGHFADFPCGWTSYFAQQSYHLNISLESNGKEANTSGYTYGELVDIWYAANATKSNVIGLWWRPEAMFQRFLGTDSELVKVTLPTTTDECLANQIRREDHCSSDFTTRVGDARGACTEKFAFGEKFITSALFESTYGAEEAVRNPGYDVIQRFQMTPYEQSVMIDYMNELNNPREAVCKWVSENIERIESEFIPPTYPREVKSRPTRGPLFFVSMTFACIAMVFVAAVIVGVFVNRKKRVIICAKIQFLFLLLSGSSLVSLGALVTSLPPTKASCIASIWLVNIGYTLELVPLIVKVAAINKLLNAAEQLRRETVRERNLYLAVFLILFFVMVFLGIWTGIDKPQSQQEYELVLGNENPIVFINNYCSSKNQAWEMAAVGWFVLLLACESALAFQSRGIHSEYNESQILGLMIYAHTVFVIFRSITLFVNFGNKMYTGQVRSLIYSFDTIINMCIYFVPKLLAKDVASSSFERVGTSIGISIASNRTSIGKSIASNRPSEDPSIRSKKESIAYTKSG